MTTCRFADFKFSFIFVSVMDPGNSNSATVLGDFCQTTLFGNFYRPVLMPSFDFNDSVTDLIRSMRCPISLRRGGGGGVLPR